MAALTRKFLSSMEIEENKIEEIIKAHTDVVTEIKDERDSYKGQVEEFKSKASELETVKAELDQLKEEAKDRDKSPYKKKYEEEVQAKEALQADLDKLKAEYDGYKNDVSAKESAATKREAYRELLTEAGVSNKRLKAVLKIAEADGKLDGIEFEEDGKVKGSEDIVKAIKADYDDYIVSTSVTGAETATPPANIGGNGMTKEDIMAIKDTAERQKAMVENPDLFGIG